jgi:SsrA-binding protein
MPAIATNKRASYDYELLDKYEAGLQLLGHEVKSARLGRMVLTGSHVVIRAGEAWLMGSQIAAYAPAGPLPGYDPARSRKLLLHKKELATLAGSLERQGLTLVPLSAYSKGSKIKIEFALAKGKKQHDKRDSIKKREVAREVRRSLGE